MREIRCFIFSVIYSFSPECNGYFVYFLFFFFHFLLYASFGTIFFSFSFVNVSEFDLNGREATTRKAVKARDSNVTANIGAKELDGEIFARMLIERVEKSEGGGRRRESIGRTIYSLNRNAPAE